MWKPMHLNFRCISSYWCLTKICLSISPSLSSLQYCLKSHISIKTSTVLIQPGHIGPGTNGHDISTKFSMCYNESVQSYCPWFSSLNLPRPHQELLPSVVTEQDDSYQHVFHRTISLCFTFTLYTIHLYLSNGVFHTYIHTVVCMTRTFCPLLWPLARPYSLKTD